MTKRHEKHVEKPSIDHFRSETAASLGKHGVTETLINEHWKDRPNVFFGLYAAAALEFFVSGRLSKSNRAFFRNETSEVPLPPNPPLSPEEALDAISGLNDPELDALVWLHEKGLRAHHLHDWHRHNGELCFGYGHNAALKVQVLIGSCSPELILRSLHGKKDLAAWDIAARVPKARVPYQQALLISKNQQRFEQLASTPELEAMWYCKPTVPHEMLCPITLRIMDDPVYIGNFRHAFERSWLLKWFGIRLTNPLTGEPANPDDIRSAKQLKIDIAIFLAKAKQSYESALQQSKHRYAPEPYLNQYPRSIEIATRALETSKLEEPTTEPITNRARSQGSL